MKQTNGDLSNDFEMRTIDNWWITNCHK